MVTHLSAEIARSKRWLRCDDVAASSSVATVAGRREGMPLPFSLQRVSTTRATSPCRLVFQLLKHPMHVQLVFNLAGQTHRILGLVLQVCPSRTNPPLFKRHRNQPSSSILQTLCISYYRSFMILWRTCYTHYDAIFRIQHRLNHLVIERSKGATSKDNTFEKV